uniref:Netrin-1 n=1 Tax=Electrophorus electricus TaxID=8005 RepID=A0A4W4HJG0_ELEEL
MLLTGSCVCVFILHTPPPHPALSFPASRCASRACSPPLGNLASGRTLRTRSSCCSPLGPTLLCPAHSRRCLDEPHPPALMADDPFLHPDTWWGSGAAAWGEDEIRLDLEARFCLTHVVLVFRSPRPAAMTLERSQDFGSTWETLKLFAENCSAAFGVPNDMSQQGALCTSRYSSAAPCIGGEVGWVSGRANPGPYAIYTLEARGTCLCHGHAEHCMPVGHGGDVQGRCVCTHYTAGAHCERCMPLYNDQPWRPANGSSGEHNPCHKCECHGHADSCRFSPWVWRSTARLSGGVCDNCQHNTAGRRCHRCRPGYHRHPARPLNSPQACTRTSGRRVGGSHNAWCHPRSGQCHCRSGVGGTSCGHCLPGHWGFGPEGCRPCKCPLNCDPVTGQSHTIVTKPGGGVSSTGKCSCKQRKLTSLCACVSAVMKASVLSAHDKGTHAVVRVKVHKVMRSGVVPLRQGTRSLYPLSWTSRGCTCPVLNPGGRYLLAGPEEAESGRLLATVQSLVAPWTPAVGLLVSEAVQQGCL